MDGDSDKGGDKNSVISLLELPILYPPTKIDKIKTMKWTWDTWQKTDRDSDKKLPSFLGWKKLNK